MLKDTHIAVGLAASTYMMLPVSDTKTTVLGMCAAVMAATFPDLDLLDEKGHSNLEEIKEAVYKACPMLFLWYGHVASEAVTDLSYESINRMRDALSGYGLTKVLQLLVWFTCVLVTVMSSHRGWSHYLAWAAVVTGCFYMIITDLQITKWFWYSILSHLLIDLLNKKSIKLLWPVPVNFRLCVCDSDGPLSKLIGMAATAIFTILVYRRFV